MRGHVSILPLPILILLILVIIAVVILCYPLTYEVRGNIEQKDLRVSVNWLFRLVRFRLIFHEKLSAILHIFMIHIDLTDPAAKEKRKRKKKERQLKKKKKKAAKKAKEREKQRRCREKEKQKILRQHPELAEERSCDRADCRDPLEDVPEETEEEEKKSLMDRLRRGLDIFNTARQQHLISAVKPQISRLLYKIRPKVIQGDIAFGFEDPSKTGRVLGAICMVPYLYETELNICPDFEAETMYVEGNVLIKGRFCLLSILIIVIRLVATRQIWAFIKAIRRKKRRR